MTMRKQPRSRRIDVALALDATGIDALWRDRADREQRWSRTLESNNVGALASAFAALESALGAPARVRLRVALMPPLAMLRRVELPRMSHDERRMVIARQTERWFVSAGQPLATAHRVLSTKRGKPSPVLVAAAPSEIVEALYAAAAERGWSVEMILPAQIAWQLFAARTWRGIRAERSAVVVCGRGELSQLQLNHGDLTLVRRCRVAAFADVMDAVLADVRAEGETKLPVALIGPSVDRDRLVSELEGVASCLPSSNDHAASDVGLAALRGLQWATSNASVLELTTEARRISAERRAKRYSSNLIAVAAAFCLAAAGLRLVGIHRELEAVRAARDALHARVERAMVLRDSLATLTSRLDALSALEAQSPRWSGIIARVAGRLPADAHLVGFHALGDSLVLDGQAENAAGVFTAMHDGAGLSSITAAAPIRQEVVPGQPTVEHWTMLARVGEGQRGGK